MGVEFELTFDDFVQALSTHHTLQRQRGVRPRTSPWLLAGVAVFVCVAIALVVDGAWNELTQSEIDPRSTAVAMAFPAPWVVLALFNAVPFLVRQGGRKTVIAFLMVVLALAVIVAAFTLWFVGPTTPWLWFAWVLVGSYWFSFWQVYIQRTSFRWFWENDRRLRGRKTLSWDADRIVFGGHDSTLMYHWHSLQGWQEASGVFLVYISAIEFQIVPKRAFEIPGLLERFRDALASSTHGHPAAFAVIPLERAEPDQA